LEDLDVGFDDVPRSVREQSVAHESEADSMEIEFGREAAPPRHPRESLDSHLMGRRDDEMDLDAPSYKSREPSLHPFGDDDLGLGASGIELGDLGITFEGLPGDNEPLPPLTPSRHCE
jgi:cohesin complex subunit SCC1